MTATTANVFNLVTLYKEYFGRGSYFVDKNGSVKSAENITYSGIPKNDSPKGTIHYSNKNISFNKQGVYGQDIWFPVTLRGSKVIGSRTEPLELEIDICTISVNLVSTIVSTPVVERKGTVNEIVNIDDYKFTIRGFLVGKNRKVPEDDILKLVAIKESTQEKTMHGGYPELFLDETCKIVISELEFPEVQGQNHWIRPFNLTCKSDFITDLDFVE
jgi:hypothetical protein